MSQCFLQKKQHCHHDKHAEFDQPMLIQNSHCVSVDCVQHQQLYNFQALQGDDDTPHSIDESNTAVPH